MTTTNGRRITTHEATITTAAIAIKTLTISGKQVTLAVFRQLIRDDTLIDLTTGQFRGLPWGHVNYHPPGDCTYRNMDGNELKMGNHLHVIWQHGDELRRATIEADARELRWALDEEIEPVLVNYYRAKTVEEDYYPGERGGGFYLQTSVCGLTVNVDIPDDLRRIWDLYTRYTPSGTRASETDRYQSEKTKVLALLTDAFKHDEILLIRKDELRREAERITSDYLRTSAAYIARYAELEALDQLFIAV